MLDPFSRGTMLVLSALSIAGAIGLATQSARSSGEPHVPQFGLTAAFPAPRSARESVLRDPFAEPARTVAAVSAASPNVRAASNDGALDGRSVALRADDDLTALPGNLPNETIPALPGAPSESGTQTARVTAVVTGPHPYAMLERAGVHIIKGLGDRFDGVAITAIDISGVVLANGQRLRVDAAGRP